MPADVPAALLAAANQPLLLAVLLFGATFIAEDVATIAAGVLVARLDASPVAALAGVILGTAIGDAALFLTGRWGSNTALGKSLRTRPDVGRAEQWMRDYALWLVFAARFLPGSRLPIFTASGFAKAPTAAVFGIIALTTPLWTAALFEAARRAGSTGANQLMITLLPFALLMLLAGMVLRRRLLAH
ncbi:MAG: VTT domain-containing protein [Sphingomonadaceae bacterium]|jgi:membrane protein DedA with SNARE-associated domain